MRRSVHVAMNGNLISNEDNVDFTVGINGHLTINGQHCSVKAGINAEVTIHGENCTIHQLGIDAKATVYAQHYQAPARFGINAEINHLYKPEQTTSSAPTPMSPPPYAPPSYEASQKRKKQKQQTSYSFISVGGNSNLTISSGRTTFQSTGRFDLKLDNQSNDNMKVKFNRTNNTLYLTGGSATFSFENIAYKLPRTFLNGQEAQVTLQCKTVYKIVNGKLQQPASVSLAHSRHVTLLKPLHNEREPLLDSESSSKCCCVIS